MKLKTAMGAAVLWLVLALVGGAGCVSKQTAQMEARQAYLAGQEQAMQAARQQGPAVFVQGPVRRGVVAWEAGLKLSQAIVTAEYTGSADPQLIRVVRKGQVVGEFRGADLLHHEDMDLEAGDTVLIAP